MYHHSISLEYRSTRRYKVHPAAGLVAFILFFAGVARGDSADLAIIDPASDIDAFSPGAAGSNTQILRGMQ